MDNIACLWYTTGFHPDGRVIREFIPEHASDEIKAKAIVAAIKRQDYCIWTYDHCVFTPQFKVVVKHCLGVRFTELVYTGPGVGQWVAPPRELA